MSIIRNKTKENNINNIISLENKLNKRPISNNRYQSKNNYEHNNQNQPQIFRNNNLITLPNSNININRSEAEIRESLNNYRLRKLIKEEFTSLIVPYHKYLLNSVTALESQIFKNNFEINQLKTKINNDLFNMENNQSFANNNKYILKTEYENKISEIDKQLSSILSFTKSIKEIISNNNNNLSNNMLDTNNYVNKNEFEFKIKEIQNIINDINKSQNSINLKMNSINKNLTGTKINENKIKKIKSEIKSIKNDIISLNNKLQFNSNNMNKLNLTDINEVKPHMKINDYNPVKNSIYNLKKYK